MRVLFFSDRFLENLFSSYQNASFFFSIFIVAWCSEQIKWNLLNIFPENTRNGFLLSNIEELRLTLSRRSLTLSRRRPLSYRNQWFLYDNGLRLERVKMFCRNKQLRILFWICFLYLSYFRINHFEYWNNSNIQEMSQTYQLFSIKSSYFSLWRICKFIIFCVMHIWFKYDLFQNISGYSVIKKR